MNADKIIAQSVLCTAKTIAVRGVGRGRKVCPACRSIVVGTKRRVCNFCNHDFKATKQLVEAASRPVPKADNSVKIRKVQKEIADLHAKLAKAHAKLADLS